MFLPQTHSYPRPSLLNPQYVSPFWPRYICLFSKKNAFFIQENCPPQASILAFLCEQLCIFWIFKSILLVHMHILHVRVPYTVPEIYSRWWWKTSAIEHPFVGVGGMVEWIISLILLNFSALLIDITSP